MITRKLHDTAYPLSATCLDKDGPVPLGTAVVRFTMRNARTGVAKVNRVVATVVAPSAGRGDADAGRVQFAFSPTHVDTLGHYNYEFEATFGDGTKATWPNGEDGKLVIAQDVDNT